MKKEEEEENRIKWEDRLIQIQMQCWQTADRPLGACAPEWATFISLKKELKAINS